MATPYQPPPLRPPLRTLDLMGGAVDLARATDEARQPGAPVAAKEELSPEERERQRDLVQRVLDCCKAGEAAYSEQVQHELDDLNFELDQWPTEFRKEREGGIAPDGHTIPAKPCLEINKLDQPIQQVLNEARMAKLAIQIKPRGSGASKAVAQVRQGLIRAIEVDSSAQLARLWALDRCIKAGRGCYRVSKKYANDGDHDLDLVIERILNQHSVIFDPFAKEVDWSDGEWCILFTDIPESEYRRRWPKSALSTATSEQLQTLGNAQPHWISGEVGKRAFRVAEFFYVVHDERELVYVEGVGNQWADELDPTQAARITRRRLVDDRHVEQCIVNVQEVLDEETWEGRYIPIIPVTGKEYNVNGKRSWRGIIANAKDAQRSYNVMRSRQIEAIGLASLSTWVMAEGQDEGYEEQWDRANTSAFVRLIYKPTTFEGNLTPAPSRDVAEPAIQAITQAVREADNDIKATTGRFDPSLGKARADQSGKAIRELKVQGESGTSNYLSSLAEVSMVYEGKVVNDMLEYVYDRPGRIVRLLGEDDTEREVMLNQPYQEAGLERAPTPLAPGQEFDPTQHFHYDLKDGGQYRVIVTVGPSQPSAREADRQFMTDLAQAAPALVPIYADLWVRAQDSKVAGQIADRLKRVNPNAQKDEGEPGMRNLPPQVVAQLEQLQQALQQATQQNQQLQEQLHTDQAKQVSGVIQTREENASKERIAILNARKDLLIEQAKLEADHGQALLDGEAQRLEADLDRRHERDRVIEDQLVAAMLTRPTPPPLPPVPPPAGGPPGRPLMPGPPPGGPPPPPAA